jgi:outer membrane murein-binding lipoprotein Lpp
MSLFTLTSIFLTVYSPIATLVAKPTYYWGKKIMKKTMAATLAACIAVAGCATASKDIPVAYVSPMQYQAYDCQQLASEIQRIQARVVQLGGRLDTAASNDKAIAGVGIILFWPALFALGGTKQQEADYARLRGEYDATEQAAILKKCPGAVGAPASPPSAPVSAPAV